MTFHTETQPAFDAIGPAARLGARLRLALRRWWLRRRRGVGVEALDDRLLRDIGLRRDLIDARSSRTSAGRWQQ
jgi:uncharacterized protein YjiS (DUF1127 family)